MDGLIEEYGDALVGIFIMLFQVHVFLILLIKICA